MKDAFQLAVDEWNAKGGVLGRPIKTLIIDDQVSVEPAVAGAQLAVQQGAVAMVGCFFSNVGIAARPTLLNNNIIFAPAGITAPDVIGTAEKPELVFRTIGLATEEAGLTAKYMLDVLGLRKVAVLHDRDDWGRSQAQIVYDAVKAYPGGQSSHVRGCHHRRDRFQWDRDQNHRRRGRQHLLWRPLPGDVWSTQLSAGCWLERAIPRPRLAQI